jgi:hypothetical protein
MWRSLPYLDSTLIIVEKLIRTFLIFIYQAKLRLWEVDLLGELFYKLENLFKLLLGLN